MHKLTPGETVEVHGSIVIRVHGGEPIEHKEPGHYRLIITSDRQGKPRVRIEEVLPESPSRAE